MTILNVVQPDEFDPSSFAVVDGKLKVAISSKADNILQYKDDGLYAPASGSNGVINRSVLTTDINGKAVYKGVNFKLRAIDGALDGIVYGDGPTAIDPDDILYYSGGSLGASFDDEKYVLELPWAVEHEQRVVMKLHQDGNPVLWMARVIRPRTDSVDTFESVTIVIDEMLNTGNAIEPLPETPEEPLPEEPPIEDTTLRAVSLSASWSESNGQILVTGRLANTYTDAWTYAHLEVETPSGQIHTAKYRIGTNVNGEVKRSLWAIAEPGEYIFRLRPWDGGETLEARATVPSVGKDFRAPIVTPTGDGTWVFSSENTEAAARGVYNVYRSRHPVSIIEDFDNDGYAYDNIHTESKTYSIPAEQRNGVWYIIVGHAGSLPGSIWTPTFFTYGE